MFHLKRRHERRQHVGAEERRGADDEIGLLLAAQAFAVFFELVPHLFEAAEVLDEALAFGGDAERRRAAVEDGGAEIFFHLAHDLAERRL